MPDALDRFVVAILARLCVDAIGRAAQREFAQRDQIAFAEEIRDRVRGLLGHVHLARLEALDQIVRRQVDEFHFVRFVEHAVGHRFRDPDVRDLPNDVVEALEVLHVDGGVDVDTGRQQFLDVLPAFRMARARRVAVREFVDQHQVGVPREHRIDVEFVQHRTAILDAALRNRPAGRPPTLRCRRAGASPLRRPRRRRLRASTSRASVSIAYVLPTPAHAPKKIFSRPVPARASARWTFSSNLSGSGRCSIIGGRRRSTDIRVRCRHPTIFPALLHRSAGDTRASLRLLDAGAVDLVAALTMRAARCCDSSTTGRCVAAERRFGSCAA